MRRELVWRTLGGAIIALLTCPGVASAANGDRCDALTDEDNVVPTVYIENGDTQEPLVKKIGALLMQSPTKLRIVYRNRPTCNIRDDIFRGARMTKVTDGTTARPVRYIPAGFDPATPAPQCTVPDPDSGTPDVGVPIALGIGATYISSCTAIDKPADIGVVDGPVQAYGFITHEDSTQIAITAVEGYLAFGFPEATGEAAPWTVQNLRFKRGDTASTTLTMSAALRLKPAQMLTTDPKGIGTSEALMDLVAKSSNPEATIGILGAELYDQHRGEGVKLLAFKAFGQRKAYFPDKTNVSFDKQNVRDGHYLPWSPTPYMAKVDGGGVFTDAHAKRIHDLVMGFGAEEGGLLQVVKSGLVPECAMKVSRAGDGADLSLYEDPAPCGCYFEKSVPGGTTTCAECTDDTTCGGGKCRLGFCEAR